MSDKPTSTPESPKAPETQEQVQQETKNSLDKLQDFMNDPLSAVRGIMKEIKKDPNLKPFIEFFEKLLFGDQANEGESMEKRAEIIKQLFNKENLGDLTEEDATKLVSQPAYFIPFLTGKTTQQALGSSGSYEFFTEQIKTANEKFYNALLRTAKLTDMFPATAAVIDIDGKRYTRDESKKGYVDESGALLGLGSISKFKVIDAEDWAKVQRGEKIIDDKFGDNTEVNESLSNDISASTIAFIKKEEGFQPTPKWDVSQYSVGYGTRWDGAKDKVFTVAEASNLLIKVLKEKYVPTLRKTIPHWNEMNDDMKGALISYAYNLGEGFYGSTNFETITRALSVKENWKDVPDAMKLYVKADGKTVQGLVDRRSREGTKWSSGLQKLQA